MLNASKNTFCPEPVTCMIDGSINASPDQWQRLAPAAILRYSADFFIHLVKNWTNFIPFIGLFAAAGEQRWLYLSIAIIALGPLAISGAILRYWYFQFSFQEGCCLIRQGVFKKSRTTVQYDRVQNVSMSQPFYFSYFGLMELSLEGAGSVEQEVKLSGIPESVAVALRDRIIALSHQSSAINPDVISDKVHGENSIELKSELPTDNVLLQQPLKEIIKYGVTSFSPLLFGLIATVGFSNMETVLKGFVSDLLVKRLGWAEDVSYFIAIGLFFLTLLILMFLVSVAGAVLAYYKYKLTALNDGFQLQSGLLETRQKSLKNSKIQLVTIKQNIMARMLHRYNGVLIQASDSNVNQVNAGKKFILPCIDSLFVRKTTSILYKNADLLEMPLKSIQNAYVKYVFLSRILVPILIIGLSGWWLLNSVIFLMMASIILLVALPVIRLRKKRFGYACTHDNVVFRTGFLGNTWHSFPWYKIQTASIRQTPGQQRKGLADLQLKLAGQMITIPFIPVVEARQWMDYALYKCESNKQTWM